MSAPQNISDKFVSRNSNGALHLLDREPPGDYLRDWTKRIAAEKKIAQPGTNSVVIFRIGIEWLALPTRVFQEVAEHCTLHTVPHRRGGVLAGLVNIRGELLLCASLGALLGLERSAAETKEKKRVIYDRLLVANRDGNRLAFPVDEVQRVLRYHPRDLKPVPATLENAAATFTIGMLPWENKTVGCLDDELLFYKLDKSFS
jgi:chemotaxis-related protein WspD